MRRIEARLRDQHEAELRQLKDNADREFTRRLKLMEEENEQRMNLMMKKMEEAAAAAAALAAQQKKKKFTGHNVAGYACDLAISPDGRFLASGDGDGRLHFWDWRRGRPLQKYRAHDDGPAIACAWHPVEPAMVATCGWDGIIKVWQ